MKDSPLRGLIIRLSSLRLTTALIFWLAAVCIIGTVAGALGDTPALAVNKLGIKRFFGLSDIFHSIWFIIPTLLLLLNLISCIYIRRKAFISLGTHKIAYALIHAGIMFIILGIFLGQSGFKGIIEIPEGIAMDMFTLRDGTPMTLPFQVRCDSFSMELYKNGMPKEYRSDITFFQDNQEAVSTSILVNHPISFKNIQFSQKGFNKIPVRFPDGSIVTGYSTILGVNKDPGLPAVIFGALIFLAGIMISFLKANPL